MRPAPAMRSVVKGWWVHREFASANAADLFLARWRQRWTALTALCLILLGLTLLGLAACAPQANTLAGSTPQTNAAQQIAASAYGAYLTADAAWEGYLASGNATRAVVARVRPLRLDARAKLDAFAAAANTGNAAAALTALDDAIAVWKAAMDNAGIPATGGT